MAFPESDRVLADGQWLQQTMLHRTRPGTATGFGRPDPLLAGTMLLTTLSLYHLAAGLLARDDRHTIFTRAAIPSARQLRRYGLSLLAIILVTELGFLQNIFHTIGLTFAQWCICAVLAATLVLVEETTKAVIRRRTAPGPSPVRREATVSRQTADR